MENLKRLRTEKGISQEVLSKYLGVSRSTVAMWEKGACSPGVGMLETLAGYFSVTVDYLIGRTGEKNFSEYKNLSGYGIFSVSTKKIPMFGEIACGEPIFADEEYGVYVETSYNINADFCLKCKGDSMINARIYDGDIVFIKETNIVENGKIAAVIIDGEATLKRVYYYKNENKLVLAAENPTYAPFIYINEELNGVKILGEAVAFQSMVR